MVNKIVNIFLLLHDVFLPFFFPDHCAILELGYLKSGKIAYPELVRSRTFRINDLLLYFFSSHNLNKSGDSQNKRNEENDTMPLYLCN
jgi:hypothetical protein